MNSDNIIIKNMFWAGCSRSIDMSRNNSKKSVGNTYLAMNTSNENIKVNNCNEEEE